MHVYTYIAKADIYDRITIFDILILTIYRIKPRFNLRYISMIKPLRYTLFMYHSQYI